LTDETSQVLPDTDPEQAFYRKWGYLPPLDEEVAAIIEAIMANPGIAKESSRINPESSDFSSGLRNRNVLLKESAELDGYAKHIRDLKLDEFSKESNEEEISHGQLWDQDLEKCTQGSNEALFQRTVMMFLIARHCLIYKADGKNLRYLDFSVEEPWTCFPMPTRAYERKEKFLTQPKPDLAVCFVRKPLIPNYLWNNMPKSTQRLACYENMTEIGSERVFHFCTIEAKKSLSSPDDMVAKRQSLNNASQALHNMFEFFRDAGEGHEKIFFDQVRFFSVVASTEGLTIRIHRAVRDSGSEEGFIMPRKPEYPLRFEFQVFEKVLKNNFDRRMVLETFAKILVGYGVNELRPLLATAAEDLMTKLDNDFDRKELRQDANFYRYGQTDILTSSRKPTPAVSAQTLPLDKSVDKDRSDTTTPGPSGSLTRSKTARIKRPRSQSSRDGVEAGASGSRKR
jgi:hypothetical protein